MEPGGRAQLREYRAEHNWQQQVGQIACRFPFGKPAVQAAAPVQVEEAPKSQLNYKLLPVQHYAGRLIIT